MNDIIETKIDNKNGLFYIKSNDKIIAKLSFRFVDNEQFVIDSVEVNKEYEGKGYGKKLVAKSVEFARQNNMKITPRCSFARRIFEITSDYKDVL